MPLSGITIIDVEGFHNPNEGRIIINDNFRKIFSGVSDSLSSITTSDIYATNLSGGTIYSGSTDLYDIFLTTADGNDITRVQPGTNTTTGGTENEPTINLVDNISLNSISANTISGDSYFVGNTSLSNYLTGSSVFVSGSTGNYSIKANNDSGLDATANYAYAEGINTIASGIGSHAEGSGTTASGDTSHAEGYLTIAGGKYSHAEGSMYLLIPEFDVPESLPSDIDPSWDNIHIASGASSHVEGQANIAGGSASHAEGILTRAIGYASHAEGVQTTASGYTSHAEGQGTIASGENSHAEGSFTTAIGYASHAEGIGTLASGENSHAEGLSTIASSQSSHVEGSFTTAIGYASHAEGIQTTASGYTSHAEGLQTTAIGYASHAEGFGTLASGINSHAQGQNTVSSGAASHAGGAGFSSVVKLLAQGGGSFAHFNISTPSHGSIGAISNFSAILGGENHNIASGANSSSILGGINNRINSSVERSVIIGGNSITATTNDTVYVDRLNLKTLGTGTSVNNLGIDSNGFVVSGLTSTDTNFANTDLTFTGGRTHELNGWDLVIGEGTSQTIGMFNGFATQITFDNSIWEIANNYQDFGVSGITSLSLLSTEAVFNNNGINYNFRVEGDTDQNLLFTKASTDRVGVGTNLPTEKLHVSGNTKISGTLNVGTLGTGTSVNNLGIDSNGFVVSGLTSSGSLKYTASIPFTGGTVQTITHNLSDADVIVQLKDSTGKLIIPDEINNYTSNTVDIKVSSTETYRVIIIG